MAESYRTEEEQIEALKTWWRENGKSTIAGVVVALLLVFGWKAWQQHQADKTAAASALFDNLVAASHANQGDLTTDQQATANHLADTLISDYAGSTYALFALFYKAQLAVVAGDLPAAEQALRTVISQSEELPILAQAKLRLAKVLYAQDRYDDALAQLDNQNDAGYLELKGDIYAARSELQQALSAYQQAQQLNQQSQAASPILAMKIQQLSSTLNAPVGGDV